MLFFIKKQQKTLKKSQTNTSPTEHQPNLPPAPPKNPNQNPTKQNHQKLVWIQQFLLHVSSHPGDLSIFLC